MPLCMYVEHFRAYSIFGFVQLYIHTAQRRRKSLFSLTYAPIWNPQIMHVDFFRILLYIAFLFFKIGVRSLIDPFIPIDNVVSTMRLHAGAYVVHKGIRAT